MSRATITAKGQITIPKEVRTAIGVEPGDLLDFVRLEDGNYAIIPATVSIKSLKGVFKRSGKPATLAEMDAAIVSGARGE